MTFSGLIWDLSDTLPKFGGRIFDWRSSVEGEGVISIPYYLELNAVRLRANYLAFIHDLGALKVRGQPVSKSLEDKNGNNFWWMGLIAEKNPFKTPEIYQVLRMLALEEILLVSPLQSIEVHSCNTQLIASIRALCKREQIKFKGVLHKRQRVGLLASLSQIRNWPNFMQGLLGVMVHLIRRWPLRKVRPIHWHQGERTMLFCSYFAHLDTGAAKHGRFVSHQWGPLPEMLTQQGMHLNWLQNFWPGQTARNATAAVKLAQQFNSVASTQGMHGFVDSYLDFRILLRAFRSWLFLCWQKWLLDDLSSCLQDNSRQAYLWPILENSWASSLSGRVGFENCLTVHLFDAAMRDLPHQPSGLYLFENQGWEKAFLTAWRRHCHGSIIGVVHATVPFWHLNYAEDPRSLLSGEQPQPDLIAVNGDVSRQALLAQGFSSNQLVPVEALRYLSLEFKQRAESHHHYRDPSQGIRVLVLGDMDQVGVRDLLLAIKHVQGLLPRNYQFDFKPHPAYPVDPLNALGPEISVVDGPLSNILVNYDCVVAGNSTSACIDAFLSGKTVIIGRVRNQINLSPLRGIVGVDFFESPQQLALSLLSIEDRQSQPNEQRSYFYVDDHLTLWKKLLCLEQTAAFTKQNNMDECDGVVSKQGV